MITIDEIRSVASKVALGNLVVEKDYALGWLLHGIHNHPATREHWVFKGGTCLKKCYFETYRFSEDLDFSFRGPVAPTEKDLIGILADVSDWVEDQSGLGFPKESIKFEVFTNPRGTESIQGGIKYRGPVRPQVGLAQMQRIKIDLTLDEPVLLDPVIKRVDHPYSDAPDGGISVLAYDYEEIFAEKVRALAQRLRPRDLYDVIHLYRRMDLNPDRNRVYSTLERKCQIRGMSLPTIEILESHGNRSLLESEWENQLAHQLPTLPEFGGFLSELPLVLDWIHGAEVKELEPLAVAEIGEQEAGVRTEAVASLVLPGVAASYLDRVRFAAANRLVIRLGYNGSYREIEPYSLARSSEGNLLLRTVRSDNREARTYRWDRIESIQVTNHTFKPEYAVEITSAGHLPIHQLTRNPSAQSGYGTRKLRARSSGPTYVFQCTTCRKIFRRKSMDSTLKQHKNPRGQNCYGSYGRYLRTEYR